MSKYTSLTYIVYDDTGIMSLYNIEFPHDFQQTLYLENIYNYYLAIY